MKNLLSAGFVAVLGATRAANVTFRALSCYCSLRTHRFIRTSAIALAALVLAPSIASAGINCTLTDFTVVSYDDGGAYLHGTLNGTPVIYITICGQTSNNTDCNAVATNRNLAVALAAQAEGRSLEIGFWNLTACSAFTPYTRAASVRMLN